MSEVQGLREFSKIIAKKISDIEANHKKKQAADLASIQAEKDRMNRIMRMPKILGNENIERLKGKKKALDEVRVEVSE